MCVYVCECVCLHACTIACMHLWLCVYVYVCRYAWLPGCAHVDCIAELFLILLCVYIHGVCMQVRVFANV